MPSFNLAEEAWIPCIMPDGTTAERGLRDTLEHAHEIREVFDTSPLVTLSLHRLLLTILHRVFAPENLADWQELWAAGRWDAARLASYFGQWGPRFDLFDSRLPFYQQADFTARKETPIKRLAFEFAAQNNATLFDHSVDDQCPEVPFAVAARWLVTTQAVAPSAGKSENGHSKDSPCSRGATVLLQGDTLFETLCLNLLSLFRGDIPEAGEDAPCWENSSACKPEHDVTPAGPLDYLTMRSRWVRLLPGGNGVAACYMAQGRALKEGVLRDPFLAYRRDEESFFVWMLNEHRAVWRDSHALFHLTDNAPFKLPESLNRAARLVRSGVLDRHRRLRLCVIGQRLGTGQPTIHFWRHERLPLPLQYLNDQDLLAALQILLSLAEEVADRLEQALFLLARQVLDFNKAVDERNAEEARSFTRRNDLSRNKKKDPTGDFAKAHGGLIAFWGRLEAPFKQLLVALSDDRAEDAGIIEYGRLELPRWAAMLRQTALDAFTETACGVDRSARTLKATAKAEAQLHWRIHEIVNRVNQKGKEAAHADEP